MLVAKQPLYQPQPPLRQPTRAPQKKVKTAKISDAEKRFILLAILCLATLSLGMIWRFAQVNDMQTRINKLENGIAKLENGNAALTIQLKQLCAPRQIEVRASKELGMRWPLHQQIINVLEAGPEQ